MRVLTSSGTWEPVSLAATFEQFLEKGLSGVRPSMELVAGPDGERRFVDYGAVYRTNPWLFATVQMLGNGLARMPLKVYQGEGVDRQRVRPGTGSKVETLALRLRRPGHRRSGPGLRKATMVDRKVHGNALWLIERSRRGDIDGFVRIPWRFVGMEKLAGVQRYWDTRSPETKHLADDVIHFGLDSDLSECAPSPIDALHATVSLYDAVERHLLAFFKNSARPSAHVEVDKGTGKEAREMIAASIRQLYTSPENAGKVLVTSGKWTPITASPDNSRVIELAKQAREEIVAVYNMPPPMVGILDRAIMANVRELRSHYARDVVGPDAVLLEGDIDAQMLSVDPDFADVIVEAEMSAVMRADAEARAATYKDRRYVETLNEIRATETLPAIAHPDADVPWMPLNEQPLGTTDPESDQPTASADADLFERPKEADHA